MIFFRDEGNGEPVLLVHGLGASGRIFDHLFEARDPAQRLVAFDLPRTARSGHWARSRPDEIADRVVELMGERGLSSVHLFGHSFGGLVCLSLAARWPHLAKSLTVVAAPAVGLPIDLRLLLDHPLTELSYALLGRTPAWRPMLHAYLDYIWGRPGLLTAAQKAVYEEAQRAEGFGAGVLEALRAIGRFRLDTEALRSASFPKTVLWGDRDPLVAVGQGAAFARSIDAQFEVIEGVGHCLPDERPDLVVAAVARCLPPRVDEAA